MRLLSLSCLLGLAVASPAQVVRDVAASPTPPVADYLEEVRSAIPPIAMLGFEWHDTNDFEDGDGSVDFSVIELRSPIFFKSLASGDKFALGLDYSLANLDVSAGADSWDGQLNGLFLPITWSHRNPGSQWFFLAQAAPGLRTDFESITSDDFAFRTFAAAMRSFNANLTAGVGAYFSYDVDGIFAVPGIGFTWKPAADWMVSLIPPQLAVSYEPNDNWLFSVFARPRSYIAAIHEGPENPDIASISYTKIGIAAKHRLLDSPHVWLNLNAGYTLFSEVELQRDGQSLFDGDLDAGFFAGASLELLGW